ncbi:MAG: hypothetical protein IT440_02580 [Phycisphaeraceae bacterium]|nr:hypothetical protein [Phycisphaeraceae bacterium]
MRIDRRFILTDGSAVFSGGELLVKGALESPGGVQLFTSVAVSPLGTFLQALRSLGPWLSAQGQVVRVANHEASAVAMVDGAMAEGRSGLAAISTAGVRRAASAIRSMASRRAARGGAAVLAIADPAHLAATDGMDLAMAARSIGLTMLEPSNPQEVKDWVAHAIALSRASRSPVGVGLIGELACGGGSVNLRPNASLEDLASSGQTTPRNPPDLAETQRQALILAEARRLGLNRILCSPQRGERAPLGVVAVGSAIAPIAQVLTDLGLEGRLPLLRLGMIWPIDDAMILELARCCERIIVIERGQPLVVRHVEHVLARHVVAEGLECEVVDGDVQCTPVSARLHGSAVLQRLAPWLMIHPTLPMELTRQRLTAELALIEDNARLDQPLPMRTVTFCPGCAHRDTSSILTDIKQDLRNATYMAQRHRRDPVDLMIHADDGCCSLTDQPPFASLGAVHHELGLSGAAAVGAAAFASARQLVVIGDVAFFHGGQTAVQEAIRAARPVTFLILEDAALSDAEPLTDDIAPHPHPGLSPARRIERLVQSMAPRGKGPELRVVRIHPGDRSRLRNLVEQFILSDGVNVVVADKHCAITRRRQRQRSRRQAVAQQGYVFRDSRIQVVSDICDFCLECTRKTGCTGLTIDATPMGPRVQVDPTICVDDRACVRLSACPSFEEVTVVRRQAPAPWPQEPPLPAPAVPALDQQWRALVAGVGGGGVGVLAMILADAGHQMGYRIQFVKDKSHVARTGGVFGQVLFLKPEPPRDDPRRPAILPWTSPLHLHGKTDLILGLDLLEAARCVDAAGPYRAASPARTNAIVCNQMAPTIRQLIGEEPFDLQLPRQTLRRHLHPQRLLELDLRAWWQGRFDSARLANVMLLGAAFQRGLLPLSEDAIHRAIRRLTGEEAGDNLLAFDLGRRAALAPPAREPASPRQSAARLLRQKVRSLRAEDRHRPGRGAKLARQFRQIVRDLYRALRPLGPHDPLLLQLIGHTHQCLLWGGPDYAQRYVRRVLTVFRHDQPRHRYAVTRTVARELARVMVIMDPVHVAAMASHPDKLQRDRFRLRVDPARGDRIEYRHLARIELDWFHHRRVGFDCRLRLWQLRLLSRLTVLRKLIPGWARRQRRFRNWYEALVDRFDGAGYAADPAHDRRYQWFLALLRCTEHVRGFRDLREMHMRSARRRADELLAVEPEQFQPPDDRDPTVEPHALSSRNIPLPVLV